MSTAFRIALDGLQQVPVVMSTKTGARHRHLRQHHVEHEHHGQLPGLCTSTSIWETTDVNPITPFIATREGATLGSDISLYGAPLDLRRYTERQVCHHASTEIAKIGAPMMTAAHRWHLCICCRLRRF